MMRQTDRKLQISIRVTKLIFYVEKLKKSKYASRIKETLGGDFIPFVMSSGGGIGPAVKMILKTTGNKAVDRSYETKAQILKDNKTDLSMFQHNLQLSEIRSTRKYIVAQILDLRNL